MENQNNEQKKTNLMSNKLKNGFKFSNFLNLNTLIVGKIITILYLIIIIITAIVYVCGLFGTLISGSIMNFVICLICGPLYILFIRIIFEFIIIQINNHNNIKEILTILNKK